MFERIKMIKQFSLESKADALTCYNTLFEPNIFTNTSIKNLIERVYNIGRKYTCFEEY